MAASSDELRPVTALFADIVGSTALGERLTPGEVKALIGECVSRMSRAVEHYGGTIQAYTGDGICAYFGVPVAHEDDPERAARAALRILQVAQEYGRDVEGAWGIKDFNVRVGINGGQTGVGMVGSAAPQAVALGDTTNVAARLESAAAPGTIAVGAETARLLASHFLLESLGEISVKGRAEPVTAWRLSGPRLEGESRPSTPLVGREQEMARLGAIAEELRAGRGQILLLVGDAGIGKTRLLTELRNLVSDHMNWLEGASVAYEQDLASGAFVEMVRSWLGLEEGEPEVAVRMRLRAKLGALLGSRVGEVLPVFARMLSVTIDPEFDEPTESSPQDRSMQLQMAFRSWVEALAASGPVVLALDDLQWAGPSTCELAEAILELTDRASVMVVAALRPDPSSPGWRFRMKGLADYPHRSVELSLGPLPPAAARQLADLLLPEGSIDHSTKEGLIARSEGNPLFLEELLLGLSEAVPGDRSRSWSVSVRHLLPSSLESLFVARIDRLPPGPRHLVQVAAVIGRDFPVRVLELVAERESVQDDMAVLLRADLIRELRRYPNLECTFRHGLIQEVALQTLTADRLRELNGRVAAAYEEMFAGALDDHAQTLAYHYYRSDDQARSVPFLEQAADRAAAQGASAEANELLRRAAKVAGRLGDAAAEARLQGKLARLAPVR